VVRSPQATYRAQSEDTSPDVDRRLMDAYRAMSPQEKATRIGDDCLAVERLAIAGIRTRHPRAGASEQFLRLAALRLDEHTIERAFVRRDPAEIHTMATTDLVGLALRVAAILDALGVRYLVGGSIASSILGEPRATEDVDIVADLQERHVDALVGALAGEFYVDDRAVHRAIERRASFNAIHLASARKVDIFVLANDALAAQEMRRRIPVAVAVEPAGTLYLATAEDLILRKLAWYRKGGEVSDRQWRDVLGIIKVQADRLDWGYLREWADSIGVSDLLDRAKTQAGLDG
jgi:hypothetical protein